MPLNGRAKDREAVSWLNPQNERNDITLIDPRKMQTIHEFWMGPILKHVGPQRVLT